MDYIAEYSAYLTGEKHASQNTVSSYLRDVTQFSEYLEEHYGGCALTDARGEMIQGYMKWMQGRGKSAASITRFLASIKSFYNYLVSVGAVDANPARGLSAGKAERKYPEILTNKEVELFLEQPQCVDAKGIRDHAMLELLYATGIRVSELISLDLQDLNLAASFIRCASKGKERIIPLYHVAVKALQDYVKDVRPELIADSGEQALFVNMNGERMSRQGFLEDHQVLSGEGGDRKGHHPPHPAPLLCRPPAGKRRGPAVHPGDAGSRGHFLHPDLHPCGQAPAQRHLSKGSSQSMRKTARQAPCCFFCNA